MFKCIKDIDISNESSWKEHIFITSDIDWASDEVLSFTIELFEKYNIDATFFATHKTEILDNLSYKYEVGIHPNFNFLLQGDFRYGNSYSKVVSYYKEMHPNAVSVRSHSMTQNTFILDEFRRQRLKYDVNHFIPLKNKNIELGPWSYWQEGLTKVPYFWEDDIHCLYRDQWDVDILLENKGLKVFDFHPIHVFLNTEDMKRYQAAKPHLQNYKELKKYMNTSKYGTRDFLKEILRAGKA